jgi:electron transfer flavoprotein beta subunit
MTLVFADEAFARRFAELNEPQLMVACHPIGKGGCYMKVVVCVKQTPSTTAVLSVNNGAVSWDDPGGKPLVVNPWDEYALEQAIKLQEEHGGDAIALSMGTEETLEALKTALAMGCTEAILVNDGV